MVTIIIHIVVQHHLIMEATQEQVELVQLVHGQEHLERILIITLEQVVQEQREHGLAIQEIVQHSIVVQVVRELLVHGQEILEKRLLSIQEVMVVENHLILSNHQLLLLE